MTPGGTLGTGLTTAQKPYPRSPANPHCTGQSSHVSPHLVQFIGAIIDMEACRAFLLPDRVATLGNTAQDICDGWKSQRSGSSGYWILWQQQCQSSFLPDSGCEPSCYGFLRTSSPTSRCKPPSCAPPPQIWESIEWWCNQDNITERALFTFPVPIVTITSDTVLWEWRAHLGELAVGGV